MRRREGFTLIELLVVIAIIGILAGLLSTAIMNVLKSAKNKKNANGASQIQAACVEYWHDHNRWPIPKSANVKFSKSENSTQIAGSDEKRDTYSFKISFYGDNDKVIDLISPKNPNSKNKCYLNLNGLLTPEDPPSSESKYPVHGATTDAQLVRDGQATYSDPGDSKYGAKIPARTAPVLVYTSMCIVCPHCNAAFSKTATRKYCGNDDCSYYKANDERYYFTKADRKLVPCYQPYRITFDLDNNICTVSAD